LKKSEGFYRHPILSRLKDIEIILNAKALLSLFPRVVPWYTQHQRDTPHARDNERWYTHGYGIERDNDVKRTSYTKQINEVLNMPYTSRQMANTTKRNHLHCVSIVP
jgi:hypothetical protein